jgi:hypothetical protein
MSWEGVLLCRTAQVPVQAQTPGATRVHGLHGDSYGLHGNSSQRWYVRKQCLVMYCGRDRSRCVV